MARFPWILWFIWKARNEKVFNGKTILPPDTVQQATREEEEWRVAQVLIDHNPNQETNTQDHETYESNSHLPRCQVDASWVKDSTIAGGGCVFELEPGNYIYGSFGIEQVLSPLHAEFHILLCAMKTALQFGFSSMSFQSDCLQLVKLINEEEEWPSLDSEWNDLDHTRSIFTEFSLSFIARNHNVRANILVKGARSQNSIFSHVNSLIPMWLAHKANFFVSN
ncbi:hypothetical protein Bca52824_001759 [Brassica carinata]|uniref:RNase H type-1 domain-containing protein n=1 Tax=Brassica carinata TaxID=52824 RepID=A0A8X8BA07_BRACI|nr:hypothetical protein Bca52824_001759 [Brassica carinata]